MADLSPFHKMQGNKMVMQYTGTAPMSLSENRLDLKNVIQGYHQSNNSLWVWAIIDVSDLAFVGTCALVKESNEQYEIGVRLLEEKWGRGYGREIVKNLLCFAFTEWHAKTCVDIL